MTTPTPPRSLQRQPKNFSEFTSPSTSERTLQSLQRQPKNFLEFISTTPLKILSSTTPRPPLTLSQLRSTLREPKLSAIHLHQILNPHLRTASLFKSKQSGGLVQRPVEAPLEAPLEARPVKKSTSETVTHFAVNTSSQSRGSVPEKLDFLVSSPEGLKQLNNLTDSLHLSNLTKLSQPSNPESSQPRNHTESSQPRYRTESFQPRNRTESSLSTESPQSSNRTESSHLSNLTKSSLPSNLTESLTVNLTSRTTSLLLEKTPTNPPAGQKVC